MLKIDHCGWGLLGLFFLLLFVTTSACARGDEAPAASEPAGAESETASAGEAALAGASSTAGDAAMARTASADSDDPHAAYKRLQQALEQYRQIQAQGGWPEIPSGDLVEVGDTSARVIPLRERLAVTGDLSQTGAAEQDSVYDETLAEAVRQFQRRHGLTVDGILGPNTASALNTPVEDRIAQIERNIDRWEQELPDDFGERYIMVNIPEFRLRAFEGGEEALQMKVIVGEAYDDGDTPTFSDEMEYVVFRPYWNIPHSIAVEEILPEAREDCSYLTENNYQIVSHFAPDAEVYPPCSTDLSRVASGDLQLREKPGPENSLGLVKFMFPNQYAVYLHDTPAEHLFDEPERDFSHGCIRVERPTDLAAFVLSRQPDWTRERIEGAMQGSDGHLRVDLQETIPVYVIYLTAFVDDSGRVQFREDLYDLISTS